MSEIKKQMHVTEKWAGDYHITPTLLSCLLPFLLPQSFTVLTSLLISLHSTDHFSISWHLRANIENTKKCNMIICEACKLPRENTKLCSLRKEILNSSKLEKIIDLPQLLSSVKNSSRIARVATDTHATYFISIRIFYPQVLPHVWQINDATTHVR